MRRVPGAGKSETMAFRLDQRRVFAPSTESGPYHSSIIKRAPSRTTFRLANINSTIAPIAMDRERLNHFEIAETNTR